jgi:hypothetical protein
VQLGERLAIREHEREVVLLGKLVELKVVDTVAVMTVQRSLKKTSCSLI